MRIWLALLAAPALALACQSAMYALVTPECSMQARIAIHAVAAVSLVLCLAFAFVARSAAAPVARAADDDAADPPITRHFLANVAAGVGVLSALVIACMWAAAWILSPCFS